MTARRIFLSPAESRGLLAGRVSLLLRPVTQPPPAGSQPLEPGCDGEWHCPCPDAPAWVNKRCEWHIKCPFGVFGDTVWGAEAWRIGAWREDGGMVACDYAASPEVTSTPWMFPPDFETEWVTISDELARVGVAPDAHGQYLWEKGASPLPWRSSSRMPRWASRHALTLTSVRVLRVRDISEEDARACGSYLARCECFPSARNLQSVGLSSLDWCHIHGERLAKQWTARYGAKHPWESARAWALGVERAR